MLSGQEVPSHRFNAGEKIVFWGGVFALGLVVVSSGLVLDKLDARHGLHARPDADRSHDPLRQRRC